MIVKRLYGTKEHNQYIEYVKSMESKGLDPLSITLWIKQGKGLNKWL